MANTFRIIAILALIASLIIRYVIIPKAGRRVSFNLIFLDADPYKILINQILNYRFALQNNGKTAVEEARCSVVFIKKDGADYKKFNGIMLKWVDKPEEKLTIEGGESAFINIITGDKATGKYYFFRNENLENAPGFELTESGTYDIELMIYGANFDSEFVGFKLEYDNSLPFENRLTAFAKA